MDNNSLSHTTWNCKYHIVFAPKLEERLYTENLGRILQIY